MRKLILTVAAAVTVLAAGSLSAQRAEALPAASGLSAVANELDLTEDARLVCRRVWVRGRLRTRCVETRPRVIVRRPYHRSWRGPRVRFR